MQCPFCQTENRDDREKCYACDKDLAMLRVIVNKAKHHYNLALEHAERGRVAEAINELHNTIDLDKKFANAHVVLGTLYAKQKEFGKAREAWQAALSLQPELLKAHQYIARAETVESSMPTLVRLRMVAVGLLAAVVMLLGAIGWRMYQDRPCAKLTAAEQSYRAGSYRKALRQLGDVLDMSTSDSIAAASARALRAAIEADQRQQVKKIQILKFRGDFQSALNEIAALEALQPDPVTSSALAMIKDDIHHYHYQKIMELYNGYIDGTVGFEQLEERIQEYASTYPDSPEKDEIRAYLETARDEDVSRRIDALAQAFDRKPDARAALNGLKEIRALGWGAAVYERRRAELIEHILTMRMEKVQDLMDKRDFAGARRVIAEVRALGPEVASVVNVQGPADLAERVLADEERSVWLEDVGELVKSGDPNDAELAVFELLADDALTTAEREVASSYLRQLDLRTEEERISQIRERYDDLLDHEEETMALAQSDDDASYTLATALWLMDEEQDIKPAERARLLAYAAASALQLGSRKQATELLGELRSRDPKNKYIEPLSKALAKKRTR